MSQAGGGSGGGLTVPVTVPNGGTGAVSFTAHSLLVGEGVTPVIALGAATNGQIPIGSTGADPVLAAITAGGGISVTNAAGSITIAATGVPTTSYTPVTAPTLPFYTVLATDCFIGVDSTAAVQTIKLPNAPAIGTIFYIKDAAGTAAAFPITVTTIGGAVLIDAAASYTINLPWESISVIFSGTAYKVF